MAKTICQSHLLDLPFKTNVICRLSLIYAYHTRLDNTSTSLKKQRQKNFTNPDCHYANHTIIN